MTTYLIRINSEPEEEPLRLSQADFDLIMDLGAREGADYFAGADDLKPFATVETEPAEDEFTWRGEVVSGDDCERLFAAGFSFLLRSALDAALEQHAREQAKERAVDADLRLHEELL